jgi:hypothetical protein
MVTRLRKDIREIGEEPGWQNYWQGEGYTPDYSNIRTKLETLLKAGQAMAGQEKHEEWNQYLQELKETHFRKRRFIEIMEGMEGKPIVKKRR